MDLLAVVLAQLLLLLSGPAAQGLLEVETGVLGADHEANLPGGVGWDRGVAILDIREDLLASLLQVDNERHVEPLVLGYIKEYSQQKFHNAFGDVATFVLRDWGGGGSQP